MQQPRVSLFKRPLLWLGVALAVTLAVVLMRYPAPHSISYIRYVSPPRLDGTRCTFLYPANLEKPLVSGGVGIDIATRKQHQIQSVQVFSRVSSGKVFVKRFSLLRRLLPSNDEEISINSVDAPAYPDPFPTRLTHSENPRYIRSESIRIGEYGSEHDIILKDKLSQIKYDFQYICWLPNTANISANELANTDAVVSRSFQVLPPGVPPPMDTRKP